MLKMPLYAGNYAICAFLQNMRNMLRSHDRCKPVSLVNSSLSNLVDRHTDRHTWVKTSPRYICGCIIRRNRSCSASDSDYSYTFLRSVVCLSVCRLSHSCTLLKPFDGCSGTLVTPGAEMNIILC